MSKKPMIYGANRNVVPPAVNPYAAQIFFTDAILYWDRTPLFDGIEDWQEVTYDENMPGMTLDEFQAWSDQIINESKCEEEL